VWACQPFATIHVSALEPVKKTRNRESKFGGSDGGYLWPMEVVRLRDEEGLSWRAIGAKLGIPAMTALDSYRQSAPASCTETVVPQAPVSSGKRRKKTVAA